MKFASKPLFRDPIFDGAADPVVVFDRARGVWKLFYTNRRASVEGLPGVSWVHGSRIGVAESTDGGANWAYSGTLDLPVGGENDTHWAPDIVFTDGAYHMFLTFVSGTPSDWNAERRLFHLVSADLVDWRNLGQTPLDSDRVLDASVVRSESGEWFLFYNDERAKKTIFVARGPDGVHWKAPRQVISETGEGPKVFFFSGRWRMLVDRWGAGIAVYHSDDLLSWTVQPEPILLAPGTGEDDRVHGGHADVVVTGAGRAFCFYFTHPGRPEDPDQKSSIGRRSSIQVVELTVENDVLVCDRDAPVAIELGDSRL